MFRYSAFSLTIHSELELPELAGGSGEPDVTIRFGGVSDEFRPATIDDQIAVVRHIGRFHIKRGEEIVVDLLLGADTDAVQVLIQGRIMAYLLRQRGCLPLHASGIAIDGQGVLFLGESGAGKSTTAAAFYSRGHKVLTDDVGAVRLSGGSVTLRTAWPGLRLLDDARAVVLQHAAPSGFRDDKHVFSLDSPGVAASCLVKRIYFLEYGAEDSAPVRTDIMSVPAATALLNSHSFILPWRAGHELRRINLGRAASIAAAIPVRRLVRPRVLSSLSLLVNFVEEDIAADE